MPTAVCTVEVQRPWRVHEAKYMTPTNGTYSYAGFHNGQASSLNMKVLVFAEPGHVQLFCKHALLTWIMIKSVVPSVTTPTSPTSCSTWALYKDYGMYVHHSQATSISYTFLVADYWSSTATLSYKSLCIVWWWSAHLATGLLHCSKCRTSTENKKKVICNESRPRCYTDSPTYMYPCDTDTLTNYSTVTVLNAVHKLQTMLWLAAGVIVVWNSVDALLVQLVGAW